MTDLEQQPSALSEFNVRSEVHDIAVSSDGKFLVCGNHKSMQVWRDENGEWKKAITLEDPFMGKPSLLGRSRSYAVAISKDCKLIATGTAWGWVHIWSATTFEKVTTVAEGRSYEIFIICGVDFSPDATRVASAFEKHSVTVWDLATSKAVFVLRHDDGVRAVKYSPQGDKIATAGEPQAIRIWDSKNGNLLFDTPVISAPRYNKGLVWSNDHIFIVCGAEIKELDASTGVVLSEWPVPDGNDSSCLSLLDYGEILVHAADRRITLWHMSTRSQLGQLQDNQAMLGIAPFPDDQQLLAIGGDGGKIRLQSLSFIIDSILSRLHPTFREPDLQISGAALDLWKKDRLTDAEALLTTSIEQSKNSKLYDLACRSLIRSRLKYSDLALVDAEQAIEGQPPLIAYIAKSVAHIRNGEKEKGYQACDIAFERFHSSHVTFLLLIKAVIVFMAGDQLRAISRLDDLITMVDQNSICYLVQAYMYFLRGDSQMRRSSYGGAVESLKRAQAQMRHHTSRPLTIISLISGWNFGDLEFTIRRRLCEALVAAGSTKEAVACFQAMANEFEEGTHHRDAHLEWAAGFVERSLRRLEQLGDTAMDTKRFEEAIAHFTTALSLKPPSPQSIHVKRGKAYMATRSWMKAAEDANQIIALDPASPWGYEMKHAALHEAGDYDNAIKAFEAMLSKISESPERDVQRKGEKYTSPSSTKARIRKIVDQTIRRLPSVLISAESGCLYDRAGQVSEFESSRIFKELVSSMTTRIDLARIKRTVRQYFAYVMFSHKWEENEPLFHQVVNLSVYDLDESPTHDKLQMFCKIVRSTGFRWAWSDTCCINKSDNFILQEALVAMFKWYEGAILTIVFLRGVRATDGPGALSKHVWNTRGWTLQEYIASKAVRFYTEEWTPYLDLKLPNHKHSPEIIAEMEEATGVSAEELMRLYPGLSSIREKLRLASTRHTTLIEDAAYSLLGIFSVAGLSAIYGEGDAALGRLLAHVLAGSGDVSILAWTGESGSYNSCLPARTASFTGPATPYLPLPIPSNEMESRVAALQSSSFDLDKALNLYDRVCGLQPPWFAASRMKLPCIVFQLPPFLPYGSRSGTRVYRVETTAFGTIEVKTRFDLSRRESLYLVHPWLDSIMGREETPRGIAPADDFAPPPSPMTDDEKVFDEEADDDIPPTPLPPYQATPGRVHTQEPVDRETRALRLLARLRQPFGALLLAPVAEGGRTVDHRRIAADAQVMVQLQENVPLADILDNVRTLDVL